MGSSLARSASIAFSVAALLTLVLVDTDTALLTRQAEEAQLGVIQRAVLLCYSLTFYYLALFPVVLLLDVCLSPLLRRMRAVDGRGAESVEPGPLGRRMRLLQQVLLGFLCIPLLASALAMVIETKRNRLASTPAASSTDRELNVILILIDTLRADHLGSYGYPRETTPFLDSLANEGAKFTRAYTHASWTKPSVASILTSLYPATHGANHFAAALPESVVSVGELMHEAGFVTYAHVTNPNLKSIFHFDQGFQFYDDYSMRDRLYLAALRGLPLLAEPLMNLTGRKFSFRDYDGAGRANARIFRWLDRYHDERFFMYLHYMDPHFPYAAPESYADRIPQLLPAGSGTPARRSALAGYDAEIRFVDEAIRDLMTRLRDLGIADETVVIVTSDHGEAFGEHGDWGHDHTIYQDQLHVPLIVHSRALIPRPSVIDTPVRSVDIAPTILGLAAVAPPDAMEGRDLMPMMRGEGVESGAVFVDHSAAKNDHRLKGLIAEDGWKYILTLDSKLRDTREDGREELYDLGRDPGELDDLSRSRPRTLRALRRRVAELSRRSKSRALDPARADALDPATEQQLKALGYLE
jgi:arylsulfatase A-like enzyme